MFTNKDFNLDNTKLVFPQFFSIRDPSLGDTFKHLRWATEKKFVSNPTIVLPLHQIKFFSLGAASGSIYVRKKITRRPFRSLEFLTGNYKDVQKKYQLNYGESYLH